jgi:hypothetical protein
LNRKISLKNKILDKNKLFEVIRILKQWKYDRKKSISWEMRKIQNETLQIEKIKFMMIRENQNIKFYSI